ncbi:helix-turn-helix transcriptional regulator [Streptomonospora nanhaiensis]|uniref:helix-turn-helix transcriptional regulator n=1 Tax=Streptomonospora nanhaiensis TaxID=1323731 RepID=UPI001C38B7C6|nr:helix-turn-helix transcriptional regulator [Streptomonospora nanhaiensis]MBV2364129.1 helix-turn-helix transcriptional regulator [Streptomonospora nanhaiensis]
MSELHRIAEVIADHCGHTKVKSHRLAWKWTVQQAAEAARRLAEQHPDRYRGAAVAERSWKSWEAGERPNATYQDLLCRLFHTGPVALGFAVDYAPRPWLGEELLPLVAAPRHRSAGSMVFPERACGDFVASPPPATATGEVRDTVRVGKENRMGTSARSALRRRREELGLSQEAAAHAARVDRSTWHRWETGKATPIPQQRKRMAAVLDVSLSELTALLRLDAASGDDRQVTISAVEHSRRSPSPAVSLKEEVERAVQDRRRFLALTGTVLAASITGAGSYSFTSQTFSPAAAPGVGVLAWLEEEVPRLRRMDDQVAGEALRQVVLGELRIAVDLLGESRGEEYERRTLTVVSHLAQLGGWISFDEGWNASAQSLFTTSLKAAHWANDTGLVCNALAAMAFQSALTGHPADGVQLAEAGAQQAVHQPPRIRALLASRKARAYALSGDRANCERSLNEAEDHFQRSDSDDSAPEWIYYLDESELHAQAGACWLDLGRPRRALDALESALHHQDPAYVRDGAIYRIRTARAHIGLGDLDHGSAALAEAAALARRARATRPLADLEDVRVGLNTKDPGVRALNEQIRALTDSEQ